MTNPTIQGRKIRRAAAAFGIALAALTLSTAAQADRGDRSHRGRDSAVHADRDTRAHRNRGDRSTWRDNRNHRNSHARDRGHNRWRHGHKRWHRGHYRHHGHPRFRAGFFPGRHYHPAPHRRGHRIAVRPHRFGAGRGCRVVKHVRFDHYGRKIISKRRVCYGRHGR